MRCLAVCHTELVVRLLEAVLAPAAELDVLVESRALARKVEHSDLSVSVDEVTRIDSYVKLGVTPVTLIFVEDNGRRGLRKVIEAVRGAGGTLIYVLGTSLADVRKASESGFSVLVDVRSREEYTGEWLAPPGFRETSQRGGHIPGAKSIPWNFACEADGTFKSYELLRELYESHGVDGHLPVITYCRIGERSSHTWFVLKYLLGYDSVRNYDGSWTEWGNLVGAAVERGEPRSPASVA